MQVLVKPKTQDKPPEMGILAKDHRFLFPIIDISKWMPKESNPKVNLITLIKIELIILVNNSLAICLSRRPASIKAQIK